MRFLPLAPIVCLLLSLSIADSVFARVGESQESFERRLLQPNLGKFMPRERFDNPYRELEMQRQQPFHQARAFFPEAIREHKYWKSAIPNMLSNDNGWKVHIFYADKQSVLEAYERVGERLSKYEVRNILEANQGTSEWHQVDAQSLEGQASAIGCDYQLADGTLRAKVSGDWIMVYTISLDQQVKQRQLVSQAIRASEQEERLREQQRSAPASTAGF